MASKGQAWFCTTGLPSDVVVEVDDMTFHLHKFPLMSKSNKLHGMITEQETNPTRLQKPSTTAAEEEEDRGDGEIEEEEVEEEEEEPYCHISLPEFPGGSEAFEVTAKFCYGVKIELSASNVAPLRCAGEVLEMTEEYSEDNLISRTERFLSETVLKSIKDSIRTLKSCEGLMPMAETLGIVQRCIDSIGARVSSIDPSLFGWPVNEVEPGGCRKTTTRDSWLEELALLSLPLFKRLIFAMKARDLSPEVIESCLIHYAKRYIPGISRSNRKSSSSSSSIPSEREQRELLETVIANLPVEKSSSSSTATRFLFGLLRTANILNASEACRASLERKIGSQLEQATLDDLLIPSYSYLNETLYDVHCIERILGYFLDGLEEISAARIEDGDGTRGTRSAALMLVGKLIDGYLSEIASDANLKQEKFLELAVALPDHARLFDDGLYRAVDVYLKVRASVATGGGEREKICGVMDCQKLTLEACAHAAQNERLPLRTVVQVLFFEQLQLRHAIAGTLLSADVPAADLSVPSNLRREEERDGDDASDAGVSVTSDPSRAEDSSVTTWRATCSSMKTAIEKIDKVGPPNRGRRSSLAKKFGCKFKTQVCDSHQPTVVETRKGRNHHRPP
ncbi:phototropic-responsive NPH3 family protein [Actinidia rufa]|uniref:Phototropic-responsive NPH3 family protein n=1 Tax=Actinidia rufa TaxID=165716 RepID=A0A7J0F7T9_9ERIC|nr:phototropic-responsive NPH3 family protein [Actinidia rufa]